MTKITIAIGSAIIVALAGTALLQEQKIQELRMEISGLTQQAEQVAPLQEKLEQATQAAVNGANSLSEHEAHDLARLRNEVSQLRQQTNELAKARRQINRLNQQVATEAEGRKNAVANAQAIQTQTRQVNTQNACINNLRLIDSAKQQWALEQRKQNTDTPQVSDLRPYLGRGVAGEMPICPDGGTYTFGTVGEKPTCSQTGHVLP